MQRHRRFRRGSPVTPLRRHLLAAMTAAVLLAPATLADALPDDTASLKRSVDALAAGTTLSLGNRTYVVNSDTLAGYPNRAFNIPHDNVTVRDGTIIVSGTSPCGIFHSIRSNTTFRNVRFIGNNVNGTGTTLGYGTAIVFNNPGAIGLGGFVVEGCSFKDFKGMGWVWANVAGAGGITGIRFAKNHAEGGDAYLVADGGTSSAPFFVGTSGTGTIKDVTVSGNVLDARKMKGGIQIIGNGGKISNVTITGNTIRDMAAGHGAAVANAYGITLKPGVSGFSVTGNDVSAYTAGIYAVSANNGNITGNRVANQAEKHDSVIYRGGIVFGGDNIVISGNTVDNCYHGIQGQMGSSKAGDVLSNNKISTTGGPGVKIGFQPGTVTGGLSISGNNLYASAGGGIKFHVHAKDKINNVSIAGNLVHSGGSYGIYTSGTFTSDDWYIFGNDIVAKNIGISLDADGATRITIASNKVVVLDDTALYGIKATNNDTTGAAPWKLLNNSVHNVTNASGSAYYTYAVTGALDGNKAFNCTKVVYDGLAGYRLGLDAPWWTANTTNGAFVQRLGGAARFDENGTMFDGWVFDNSAWKHRRIDPAAR